MKIVKKSDLKEVLRKKVLEALTESVSEVTELPTSLKKNRGIQGWSNKDLPELFRDLDKQVEKIIARFRTKESYGSGVVQFDEEN